MRNGKSIAIFAACITFAVAGTVRATTVTYLKEATGAGASASTNYGGLGYDLYGTSPVGFNSPTNTSGPYSTGTRITQLPSFVSSITAPSGNYSASGFNFYSTINNPAGGQVELGYSYAKAQSTGVQNNLSLITIGQNPPALFDIGILANATGSAAGGGPANDDNDFNRIHQTTGGAGDSGLIASSKATSVPGVLDVYFFQVANAAPGDVFTISGIENGQNIDTGDWHATLPGLLFPTTSSVPEPGTFGLLCAGGLAMLGRRRSK
jgi:hypothetical protein